MNKKTKGILEYLRREIRGERASYGDIALLQSLAKHIDPSDVELLEWAGVVEGDIVTLPDGEKARVLA